MRDGQPVMTVTLMGVDMQSQSHAQLLVNVIDLGANVQAAADMARFRHSQVPNVLNLESSLYDLLGGPLAAMGHTVRSITGAPVGGVQVIRREQTEGDVRWMAVPERCTFCSGLYESASRNERDGTGCMAARQALPQS